MLGDDDECVRNFLSKQRVCVCFRKICEVISPQTNDFPEVMHHDGAGPIGGAPIKQWVFV